MGFYADERNLNFNVHETDSRASEKGCGMLLGKFAFCYGSACTEKGEREGTEKGNEWHQMSFITLRLSHA